VAPAVALADLDHEKLAACDRQIEAHLERCAERQAPDAVRPKGRPRQRTRQRPRFDGRGTRHRVTGGDLTARAGLDEPPALTSISAIGLDLGRWPTVTHFSSWRGRCPHQRGSGGTVVARGTKPGAKRVATARRLAASCLQRRQRALGAFFRRMNARWGTPTAITATAPTLARLLDTLLKHGTASVRQSLAAYEHQDRDRVVQSVMRRAKALGEALVQTPAGTPMSHSGRRNSALEGPRWSRGTRCLSAGMSAVRRLTRRARENRC
jgi:transposase